MARPIRETTIKIHYKGNIGDAPNKIIDLLQSEGYKPMRSDIIYTHITNEGEINIELGLSSGVPEKSHLLRKLHEINIRPEYMVIKK